MSREQLREQKSDIIASPESSDNFSAYENINTCSKTERERAVVKGIEIMRGAFHDAGIKDNYAVFAGTALYLQGRIRGLGKESGLEYNIFHEVPSDFDAVVSLESDLMRVRAALERLPGHVFENNGRIRMFRTTGTKVFAGHFDIAVSSDQGELIHVPYPFEIFVNTLLVGKETLSEETESVSNLRVLNLEALKKQYEVIHEFDMRVEREAKKVIEFLSDKQVKDALGEYIESRQADSMTHTESANEAENVLRWLELSPKELHRFYEIQGKFDTSSDAEEKRYCERTMIRIVSGFSVKTAQREEKITSLHRILSGEVNGREQEKE